ncbi:MAG TPA: hypothetical protein DCF33_08525, partial [Saprospirales bacterium]|nr:hypothetical protein [Saprospirales bacterium]
PAFSIVLFFAQSTIIAQSKLNDHQAFFVLADSLSNDWMNACRLSHYIHPKASKIKENVLILPFTVENKATYLQLKQNCDSIGIENFAEFFLYKMAFLYDVTIQKIRIEIEGSDAIIQIKTSDESYDKSILENIYPKMGQSGGKAKEYRPLNILTINAEISLRKTGLKTTETENLKKKVFKSLDTWFHKQNKSWFKKSKLEQISNYEDGVLLLRVSNIKNIVLDMGYFEVLQIKLKFDAMYYPSSLKIEVDGKYGAGIIWTPYEDDYRPMNPQFIPQLNIFVEKLKTRLSETLSK